MDTGLKKKPESGYKVCVIGNKCFRCKHPWLSRKADVKPSVCPKCKSPYWDKPKKDVNSK